ncbi:JDVT-CTERM system glutamic-type intramembrane protease MrtJ [Noviherbaspirillum sp. Root189]|uniref:JDVT-CTERM system glutamic-type intramembrane protease MrtJ n=1 Tax=Noviherbaspirillum sp. Root189 TaxID=1736487 RepID=UPI00071042C3|nr:JDVT-CTERM system glutamic-type intramembrane protease [Noviherbaspirillum sp. Root189]KRB67788.1 hypothetical protein ASE07_08940 [Noviherbaspirillum sp. Root189]
MHTATALAIKEFGLQFRTGFLKDRLFHAAFLAGPLFLWAVHLAWPTWRHGLPLSFSLLASMIFIQPLAEELFFRGFLQGHLGRIFHHRYVLRGVSLANMVTTLAFCIAHLVHQPVPWALAVMAPSLAFGFFRERHQHIYSATVLHCFYNAVFIYAGTTGP